MTTSTYFFVESAGVKLPDGSVWGGGIELKYQIMRGESRPDMFTIYEYIGHNRVAKFNHDNLDYKAMRCFVIEELHYYGSVDMKLWVANHSEWEKATRKELVTEDY